MESSRFYLCVCGWCQLRWYYIICGIPIICAPFCKFIIAASTFNSISALPLFVVWFTLTGLSAKTMAALWKPDFAMPTHFVSASAKLESGIFSDELRFHRRLTNSQIFYFTPQSLGGNIISIIP